MFDELRGPIPDLEKYLERIGHKRPERCDLENLDAMVLKHQSTIPFETLDIFDYHLPIYIEPDKVFDKLVTRKRGGYCFEQNSLFCRALTACGYKASPRLARVVVEGDRLTPPLHRLTVVELDDGSYACDVGFGGTQPAFALKLEDGFTKSGQGQTFRIRSLGELGWELSFLRHDGETWEATMEFPSLYAEEVDFIVPNYYGFAYEDTIATKNRIVNIRTEGGSKSILNDSFIIRENGKKTETRIESRAQLDAILAEHFDIVIPGE